MVAFTPTTSPRPQIGTGAGPDEAVAVVTGTYTATASQEFAVVGPTEVVEVVVHYVKVGAAPSVVFSIEAWNAASGTWVTLLTSAAVVANSDNLYLVGPYVPQVTNVSTAHVPRSLMRVTATHGNTDTCTYSITVASL